jgi:hypothetical protein
MANLDPPASLPIAHRCPSMKDIIEKRIIFLWVIHSMGNGGHAGSAVAPVAKSACGSSGKGFTLFIIVGRK